MKRIITATGLSALAAMLVLGAFAGSAFAVPQFLWTGPLPGLVLVLSTNPQVFTAAAGLEIICQHFGAHAIASNGKAMTTKEFTLTGLYSNCKTEGAVKTGATVTPAEFLINADGSIAVLKSLVITVPEFINCSLKVIGGAPNNNLKTIKFLNNPSDLLAHVEVINIESLGSGGACGEPTVAKTEGTYRGLLLASVDNGTLRWDP